MFCFEILKNRIIHPLSILQRVPCLILSILRKYGYDYERIIVLGEHGYLSFFIGQIDSIKEQLWTIYNGII